MLPELPHIGHFIANWRDALDIAIVSLLLYQVFQLVRGSRALAVLSGLGILAEIGRASCRERV